MLFNQQTVNRKYFRSGPDPQFSRFFWNTYFVLKTFRRRFFLEERHIVLTHHQHIPEAFARVSLLERGSLGVELLSTSSGGGNHHLLISSCKYTHTRSHQGPVLDLQLPGHESEVIVDVCVFLPLVQPEMPVYISAKRGSLSWENRASVLSMFFPASCTPLLTLDTGTWGKGTRRSLGQSITFLF